MKEVNAAGVVTNAHETLAQMGFSAGALVIRAKDKTVAKIQSIGERVVLELQADGKQVTCSSGSFLKKEWKLHKVKKSAGATPNWQLFSPSASPDFAIARLKGHLVDFLLAHKFHVSLVFVYGELAIQMGKVVNVSVHYHWCQ